VTELQRAVTAALLAALGRPGGILEAEQGIDEDGELLPQILVRGRESGEELLVRVEPVEH
jgi:hypothetical protein